MNDFSDLLYALAAIAVFGLLSTNFNQVMLNNTVTELQSQKDFSSIALANEIIDEARFKAFDEVVTGGEKISDEDELTGHGNLGDDGEAGRDTYDDFDDYHGLSETYATPNGDYTVDIDVCYVSDTNFSQCTNTKTRYKRMTVDIQYPFDTRDENNLRKAVTLSYIKSLYK